MKITEYVNTQWMSFSCQNNLRSLPSVKDGLVLTNRKILSTMLKQTTPETVERLGLISASETHYKQGGTSIQNSLAGMCQGFIGTNNVPLFEGLGQFGTNIDRDASSTRYISAKIADITKYIILKEDECVLHHRRERGNELEPLYYLPVVPLCLVNGAFGIGTGFSTNVRQHHPIEVIDRIFDVLNTGGFSKPLLPWWRGWKGSISELNNNQYKVTGCFTRVDTSTLKITELPPYEEWERYKKKTVKPLLETNFDIIDIVNDSNEETGWNITVKFKRGMAAKLSDQEIIDMFDLSTTVSHVLSMWGTDDSIVTYDNVEELLTDWVYWRLGMYEKRRITQMGILEAELKWLKWRTAFIQMFISNNCKVDEDEVLKLLVGDGYSEKHLNMLMSIPIRSLTERGVAQCLKEVDTKNQELKGLQGTTADVMMVGELEVLKQKLLVYLGK